MNSIHSHDEELLEPIVRRIRFGLGAKHIHKTSPIILADLGCGPKIRFYHFARKKGITFKHYFGIDPLIDPEIIKNNKEPQVELIKNSLQRRIPLPDKSVDYVAAFAFLEHIDNPEQIIEESLRILRKGGKAIFTTPSIKGKKVLEFLSFKLGLISKREIEEHKNYFTKEVLSEMVKDTKNHKPFHAYFEFGMNNIFVVEKL